jgi:hypothetical protein
MNNAYHKMSGSLRAITFNDQSIQVHTHTHTHTHRRTQAWARERL